jgi:hypothetical protein
MSDDTARLYRRAWRGIELPVLRQPPEVPDVRQHLLGEVGHRAARGEGARDARPQPPALRFFDAGVGDGTVLARVLRSLHRRFERVPFYVAAKEISLEDIRLTLDKMPDRFLEHPELVLALTNMPYADAPWLRPADAGSEGGLARGRADRRDDRRVRAADPRAAAVPRRQLAHAD